jgi:hypothetical protein
MNRINYIGVQSVLIPKSVGNLNKAKQVLTSLGYNFIKVDISTNYYRFRQFPPPRNPLLYKYETVTSQKDKRVKLVLLYKVV